MDDSPCCQQAFSKLTQLHPTSQGEILHWGLRYQPAERIGKTQALFCASVRGRVPPGAPHRPLPVDTPRPWCAARHAQDGSTRQGAPGQGLERRSAAPLGWTCAIGWGRVGPARGDVGECLGERRRQGKERLSFLYADGRAPMSRVTSHVFFSLCMA